MIGRKLKLTNHLHFLLILLVIGMLSVTRDTNAMAGLFGEYVLFSEVSGRIVSGDAPVANATIVQSVTIGGSDTTTQTTQSASDGSFSFSEITRKKGFLSFLPAQFTAGQSMTITVNGEPFEGWVHTKFSPDANSENAGKPVKVVCDVASEPDVHGEIYGICKLVP